MNQPIKPSAKLEQGVVPPIPVQNINEEGNDGRIKVKKSLLDRAKANDFEAISIILHQFIPSNEKILFAEYYGFTGFAFVGSYSFGCLTDKRVASLKVGPFKKIKYEDGYYEDMTSGGIYQPSKFWLYVNLIIGFIVGIVAFTMLFQQIIDLGFRFFGLGPYDFSSGIDEWSGRGNYDRNTIVFSALLALPLIPFLLNSIIVVFYRINPCGIRCWVRQKAAIDISVDRSKMKMANRLYQKWSELRESRIRHIKNKLSLKPKR